MSNNVAEYVTRALVLGASDSSSLTVQAAYCELRGLMETQFRSDRSVVVAIAELEMDPYVWQQPLLTKLTHEAAKINRELLLAARKVHTAHTQYEAANTSRATHLEAPRRPPIPIRRLKPFHTGVLREPPTTGPLERDTTEPVEKEKLAERFYKRGVKYYQRGDYVRAGQRFYRALKLYPQHELARHGYQACRQKVLNGEV